MSDPRILVTGSRSWGNEPLLREVLYSVLHEKLFEFPGSSPVLVSGACLYGADVMAEDFWYMLDLPVERHPARWSVLGTSAGIVRNDAMVRRGADVCVAFFQHERSRGTLDCVARAKERGIPTVKVYWDGRVILADGSLITI